MFVTSLSSASSGGEDENIDNETEIHLLCLLIAIGIMLAGSIYPLLFAKANGTANHGLAMVLFWAMSAGFVRGVGFIPRAWIWRIFFSGWSCLAGLLLGAVLLIKAGI